MFWYHEEKSDNRVDKNKLIEGWNSCAHSSLLAVRKLNLLAASSEESSIP
jgi:hypothetical protein